MSAFGEREKTRVSGVIFLIRVCLMCEPASHASHAIHASQSASQEIHRLNM